jgi:hypothetical protein
MPRFLSSLALYFIPYRSWLEQITLPKPPNVPSRGMQLEQLIHIGQFQTKADNLLISSKKSSSSSTTSPNDNALAEYRVELFMSNRTTTINATLALQPNHDITAESLELAAEKRMEAELLAFDNAFDQATTGTA